MDDFFPYVDGVMCADGVPLDRIAAAVGTPVYVYSTAALTAAYRAYADAFAGLDAGICYAVKANGNLAVIRTLGALGAGADVVSGGELTRALAAGIPAGRIVFSGVGKTADEMAAALAAGVHQLNIESEPELEVLAGVARRLGVEAPVSVRVNPDVDARTHAKITTGKSENKFGIDIDDAPRVYARAAALPGIRVVGVAVHIGSQLIELEPYRAAYGKVAELVGSLRDAGIGIERLDLGGGLGIDYGGGAAPRHSDYAEIVKRTVGGLGCKLLLEPGRSLVGNAGTLVSRVLYVKEGATRRFLIVDAAMNDLLRPALYDAFHAIAPVRAPAAGQATAPIDVVGPVCESGDTFAKERPLPPLKAGDLLAIASAGAYGAVMASTYNARPLAAEVLCRDGEFAVVGRRLTVEESLARESLPPWLQAATTAAPPPRRPAETPA